MALAFDGDTRTITISVAEILSVKDLWSRWVDWYLLGDNSKYLPAMLQVGGDTIDPGAGTSIPIYIYLLNGWRVRPKEASHTLKVTEGILLTAESDDPFLATLGAFTVRINYQQPVQVVTIATGGGGGLTPEEHAYLTGIPQATLEADERTKLLGLPEETLTTSEHDQLMALPLSSGLTLAEHDQLMGIPLSTLTQAEHDMLMGLESEIQNLIIEGGITFQQAMRLVLATLTGKSSYVNNTVKFRDTTDVKDRVTATVDANGQRTSVIRDAS